MLRSCALTFSTCTELPPRVQTRHQVSQTAWWMLRWAESKKDWSFLAMMWLKFGGVFAKGWASLWVCGSAARFWCDSVGVPDLGLWLNKWILSIACSPFPPRRRKSCCSCPTSFSFVAQITEPAKQKGELDWIELFGLVIYPIKLFIRWTLCVCVCGFREFPHGLVTGHFCVPSSQDAITWTCHQRW